MVIKSGGIFIILLLITFIWSCEKDDIIEPNDSLTITLKNSDDFLHDFKISGDEEGATIILQATHFSISEITRNESTNWSVVYHYKPESGFIGKDSVKIQTSTGSDGSGPGIIKLVEFFFQITE